MSNTAAYQRDYRAKNRDKVAAEIRAARMGNCCAGCYEPMTKMPADGLCGNCRSART